MRIMLIANIQKTVSLKLLVSVMAVYNDFQTGLACSGLSPAVDYVKTGSLVYTRMCPVLYFHFVWLVFTFRVTAHKVRGTVNCLLQCCLPEIL